MAIDAIGATSTKGPADLNGYRTSQPPLHIKVLSDLVILFLLMSIDIQVLSDLAFILCILCILCILLQTRRGHGGGQAPALRKKTRPGPRSARACPSHAW